MRCNDSAAASRSRDRPPFLSVSGDQLPVLNWAVSELALLAGLPVRAPRRRSGSICQTNSREPALPRGAPSALTLLKCQPKCLPSRPRVNSTGLLPERPDCAWFFPAGQIISLSGEPESLLFTPPIGIIDFPGALNDKYVYISRRGLSDSPRKHGRAGTGRNPDDSGRGKKQLG